jgi:hypothetical protein
MVSSASDAYSPTSKAWRSFDLQGVTLGRLVGVAVRF